MNGPNNKPEEEFVESVDVDPDNIPKITAGRDRWVKELGRTVNELRKLELTAEQRVVDQVWKRQHETAILTFQWQQALVESFDLLLERARRAEADRAQAALAERQTKLAESQAKSAAAQTELSSSIKCASWVMAAAIIVQAAIATGTWLWPRGGSTEKVDAEVELPDGNARVTR